MELHNQLFKSIIAWVYKKLWSTIAYALTFTFILLSLHASNQTIYIQGVQSGNLLADTIILTGPVNVLSDTQLQINPGSFVMSTGYFGFTINGSLIVEGTFEDPVVFTIADTNGFSNLNDIRGGWNGFEFTGDNSGTDSSVFVNCIFTYAKASGDSLNSFGGAFCIKNYNHLLIDSCHFENNSAKHWGGAVYADSSNIKIRHCIFTRNFCGLPLPPYGYGGAVCIRHSEPEIFNCHFRLNRSTGIGGALALEYADAKLSVSVFESNFSALGGALGYLRSTPQYPVNNCFFNGNSALYFGGAISCNRSNPVFLNTTIADNYCQSYGGGFYCNDSAAPVLINTIIYGNQAAEGTQVYIWDNLSSPSFYYCNVQDGIQGFGGTGGIGFNSPYMNCIDSIPLFAITGEWPYEITENSPCVDAGNPDTTYQYLMPFDLAGNARISGQAIDIGAFEFSDGLNALPGLRTLPSLSCCYFKTNHSIYVFSPENAGKKLNIRFIDICGQTMQHLTIRIDDTGIATIPAPNKRGVLIIAAETEGQQFVAKLLLNE